MKPELKLEELLRYRSSQKVLYASDSKSGTRLYFTFNNSYLVEHNGEEVLKTMQPYDAIEKFNELAGW